MQPSFDDYLQHYGVKGMKWGKHKAKAKARLADVGSRRTATKNFRPMDPNRNHIYREELIEEKIEEEKLEEEKLWGEKIEQEVLITDEHGNIISSNKKVSPKTSVKDIPKKLVDSAKQWLSDTFDLDFQKKYRRIR